MSSTTSNQLLQCSRTRKLSEGLPESVEMCRESLKTQESVGQLLDSLSVAPDWTKNHRTWTKDIIRWVEKDPEQGEPWPKFYCLSDEQGISRANHEDPSFLKPGASPLLSCLNVG